MIRKLNEHNQEMLLSYLYQESAYNIFIIGDVETYGMETEFQRVYGEFDEENKLISVFLRYRENAVYYATDVRFNLDYLDIFKHDSFEFLSGKAELIELIRPHLPAYTSKPMYFCKVDHMHIKNNSVEKIQILQTKEQAEKLYDLLLSIDEFNYKRKDKENFVNQKSKDQKMGITLFIEQDGMIVSTVATTAETTKSAMVIAVATHKDYRNHGYASILMKELMRLYLIEKKKELCLFYDNPKAGKIYHRLGFETIGKWTVLNRDL